METTIKNTHTGEEANGWDAWDAIPRDGPAVFVLDVHRLDAGTVHGAWLSVDPERFTAGLRALLGRSALNGWAIVDQVGLGERMIPEHFPLDALRTVFGDVGGAS